MKNCNIFYGWWIVIAVFLISAYVAGILIYGFTAILEPLSTEFGWSYVQISIAASLRGLEMGLFAPVFGFLIDRVGSRKLIFAGAITLGIGFLLFSRITSLWMFYGVFIILSFGMSTCLGVVSQTIVSNWFRRKVSMAMGIAVCGSAFGGLLVPLVTQIISLFSWRIAMMIFGLVAWILLIPLSLVLRHRPEDCGLLPDGDKSSELITFSDPGLKHNTNEGIGVKQALKDRAFWHIAFTLMCHGLIINAVITHVMPFLSSIDIPNSTASFIVSAIALAGILGRLGFGWFGDRYDKRWVLATCLVISAISLLLFNYTAGLATWAVVLSAILFGIGYGGPVVILPAILSEYFGRARLGTILGLVMGIMTFGTLSGPPLAGWAFDSFGSYEIMWLAFVVMLIFGSISSVTTPMRKDKINT